ncbi:hypothetical protein DRN34_05340 [Thermococci archaeon]|nr:MAG: hypothetical protein DRN34_05340 [Thermococci archaeon]
MRSSLKIVFSLIFFLILFSLIVLGVQKMNLRNDEEINREFNGKHSSNANSSILVGNYTCEQKAALLMNLRDFKIKGEHVCPLDWLRINWTFEEPRSYECYYAIKAYNYYFASFYYTDHTKALQSYEDFISALKKKYHIQEKNIPLKDNAYSMCGNSFVDSKNVLFKTQDGYIYVELLRLSNDRAAILVVIGDENIWQIINAKK